MLAKPVRTLRRWTAANVPYGGSAALEAGREYVLTVEAQFADGGGGGGGGGMNTEIHEQLLFIPTVRLQKMRAT